LSREETLVGSIPWQLQHNIFLLEMLRISNVIFLKEKKNVKENKDFFGNT
jgi:hypothetical protein